MNKQLEKKVQQSVNLIRHAVGGGKVEVCYSGGKDSDVILELTKMAGVDYIAIYKNTTIDPPGTIKHAKEAGAVIVRPKKSFLELVQEKGMPTRRARFCCEVLKEYKIMDKAIQGIRVSESTKRASMYSVDDPIICRIYGSKKNQVNTILPILSWTDKDVEEFVMERGIKCHPLYYDESGKFHVERRLGCMGCPLASDNGVSGFKQYPKLLKAIIGRLHIYWQRPNITARDKYGSVYGLVASDLFYDSYDSWWEAEHDMFGKPDWKAKLENYFNVEL